MNLLKKLFGHETAKETTTSSLPYTPKDSDIYLVSYPKSGNTWVRFLIGNYLFGGQISFKNAHEYMPDIHYNPDQIDKIKTEPRFIKSHETFNPDYKKVIYIVRDGRDVAVSYYFFCKKYGQLSQETTFSNFLKENYNTGNIGFGKWSDHVKGWNSLMIDDILIIKYEDLIENTLEQFRKIISFAGLEYNEERAQKAVELSSFSEMKKDEVSNKEDFENVVRSVDKNANFMREGKVGDYANYFSEQESAAFNEGNQEALSLFKYL